MLFFYAEGTEHCRTKERTFPPTTGRARLLQPKRRTSFRPWGGRAYHSPRGAPTMGGCACYNPRDAPTMGGCACYNPRDAPTMGGRACCSPRDAPTMSGRACCSPRDAPTMGRVRLLQPEGRADYGAGALITARGTRRPWDGRACCSPRDAPTMGRGFPPNEANVPVDRVRTRLLQQRRGRTCRNFFPIMSFGKLYEAGNAKRGSAGRAGNPGAQQGVQGVCKAKAWQSGKAIF